MNSGLETRLEIWRRGVSAAQGGGWGWGVVWGNENILIVIVEWLANVYAD